MHEAVTKSTTATKSFFPTTPDDLLAPIPLTNLSHTTDSWSQAHESNGDSIIDNWHLSTHNDKTSATLTTRRRIPPTNLQKLKFPPMMTARPEHLPLNADVRVGEHAIGPAPRWRVNTHGQVVDDTASWDLADEIGRLNIGELSGDGDDVHGQIRTPPKSKIAAAVVAQLTETSPLDTSSNTSVGSSPHGSDHQISISHSRGSSTDTTISSSHESVSSNTMMAHGHVKAGLVNEVKERPHSFSGGLSSADLRRLQQAGEAGFEDRHVQQQQQHQWAQAQYRDNTGPIDRQFPSEQPSYPSLANQSGTLHRPVPQHPQLYDYRAAPPTTQPHGPTREELQIDYNMQQQRNFNPLPQGVNGAGHGPAPYPSGRSNNNTNANGAQYRQPTRSFPQQGVLPSPTAMGYPGAHHTAHHLSLGSTQQLYDMMLPAPSHEAVTRVQQQHNVYRGTHHHSASDPTAIRDAATLALLNNNMQVFTGMFPGGMAPPAGMPMYPNQFYGTQDYGRPDMATAQAQAQVMAAARMQQQYNSQYALLSPQGMGEGSISSPTSTTGQNGPSANNRKLGLYKTELCRSWEEKGTCRYGAKCQFAHGEDELRKVSRHPKYKTEICRTFWVSGSCPYGKRCCFIHTEIPTSGAPPGQASATAEHAPPPPRPDTRPRSMSTNSDPNEPAVSLLSRISAQRPHESNGNNLATPVDTSSRNGFQSTRPPTGSLRVDTNVIDGQHSVKQNKSAYPSFASNGILLPAPEHISAKSPAPVTAGPDLGRYNNSRMEIVGYNNQQRISKANNSTNSSVRHSFNGTEVDLNFSPSPPIPAHSPFTAHPSNDSGTHASRANGHVRAGSAGNWGSLSRSSHLSSSAYPHAGSPASELPISSPWSTTELAVGSSRLHEKSWA